MTDEACLRCQHPGWVNEHRMIFLNTKLAAHIIYAFSTVSHSQHHSTESHFNHSPDSKAEKHLGRVLRIFTKLKNILTILFFWLPKGLLINFRSVSPLEFAGSFKNMFSKENIWRSRQVVIKTLMNNVLWKKKVFFSCFKCLTYLLLLFSSDAVFNWCSLYLLSCNNTNIPVVGLIKDYLILNILAKSHVRVVTFIFIITFITMWILFYSFG